MASKWEKLSKANLSSKQGVFKQNPGYALEHTDSVELLKYAANFNIRQHTPEEALTLARDLIARAQAEHKFDLFKAGAQVYKATFKTGNETAFKEYVNSVVPHFGNPGFTKGMAFNPAHVRLADQYLNVSERQFDATLKQDALEQAPLATPRLKL